MRYNKLLLLVSVSLILSGCAAVLPQPSAGSQPRALGLGALQPSCFIFCFATATFNESEGGKGSFAPSTNSVNTVSPSLSIGTGNGMPGVPAVPQ